MNNDFLGKGFNYPFQFAKGLVKSSENDALIQQSILLILSTRPGERVMRPNYGCGIHEMVFAANNGITATRLEFLVQDALDEFEPRIEVLQVKTSVDSQKLNLLNVSIEYNIKGINSPRNLVYPFYLQGGSS